MAYRKADHFPDWLCLVGSVVALAFLLRKLADSHASGALTLSLVKYGFTFYGPEAAVIYVAALVGCIVLGVIGYRGLAARDH